MPEAADKPRFTPSRSPRVAVMIPCFNDGRYLPEAVASVQLQEPSELVVIDDGSTDRVTLDVLARLRAKGVTVAHQPNSGPGPARTHGMQLTTAPYVFPLDADDYLAPGSLSTLADWLDAVSDLDVVWGPYQYVGERTHVKEVSKGLDPWLVSYLNDLPASAMFRRSTLERTGAWKALEAHEDWDLWMTLAEAGVNGRRVDDVVYHHRLHCSRRRASAIPLHAELRRKLRERHPVLYASRGRHRKRSPAPLVAKLMFPVLESVRVGSAYRRAFLAAVIWHATQRRGGYARPFRRLVERIDGRLRRPSPSPVREGGA